MKLNEPISPGTQIKAAETYFKAQIPGYVEASALAYDTIQVRITEGMGSLPLPYLLNGLFGAAFVMGSLFAQGKGERAMEWLAKQKPGLGDG